MMRDAPILATEPFTRLPDPLRHRGRPSRWAQMTRPGQPMHSFIEGAFFDADRYLWLCDVPGGRVFRVCPAGGWETVHDYGGEPHSMRIGPDGRRLAADYALGLLELTGESDYLVLSKGLPDRRFKGLSDMAFAPDGALWFTDSGRTSLSDASGGLYRRSADGALRLILDMIPYPNGVAVSPSGDVVYVAVTRANAIWSLSAALHERGAPMAGVFLQLSGGLGPDGLATNPLGWLAIAQARAGRAYVVDALGDPLAEVRLPQGRWTTSVAFHPDDPARLYITEAQAGVVHVAHIPEPGAWIR